MSYDQFGPGPIGPVFNKTLHQAVTLAQAIRPPLGPLPQTIGPGQSQLPYRRHM